VRAACPTDNLAAAMNRTLAYADALRTFATRLTTLVEATPALTPAELETLLVEVRAAGEASGLPSATVADQVSNTVLFLRTDALANADRKALAAAAAEIMLKGWDAGDPGGSRGAGS
jgi:hypothetical protein